MRVNDIPEIAQLSVPEKILFVEELWDSIMETRQVCLCHPVTRRNWTERLQSHALAPGNCLSLEELQDRVERRK